MVHIDLKVDHLTRVRCTKPNKICIKFFLMLILLNEGLYMVALDIE